MLGIPVSPYLVGTDEATAKGSQELNDGRAAVAPDWVERPNVTHVSSPANVLRQNHTQVCHEEGVLLCLGETKTNIDSGTQASLSTTRCVLTSNEPLKDVT